MTTTTITPAILAALNSALVNHNGCATATTQTFNRMRNLGLARADGPWRILLTEAAWRLHDEMPVCAHNGCLLSVLRDGAKCPGHHDTGHKTRTFLLDSAPRLNWRKLHRTAPRAAGATCDTCEWVTHHDTREAARAAARQHRDTIRES